MSSSVERGPRETSVAKVGLAAADVEIPAQIIDVGAGPERGRLGIARGVGRLFGLGHESGDGFQPALFAPSAKS